MKRRDFITLLGGAAATRILLWPRTARAQQGRPIRHVGYLTSAADDADGRARFGTFVQSLQELGWSEGRNIRFDARWGDSDTGLMIAQAKEMVGLKPEVILVNSTRTLLALQRTTQTTIPIVFVGVSDPLGQGIVTSLARPGGSVTGFSNLEFSLIGKWLQMLKEIAPGIARVALLSHPENGTLAGNLRSFTEIAPSLTITPIANPIRDDAEIERALAALAQEPNGALILPGDTFLNSKRSLIVELVTRYRLPAVAPERAFAQAGGLMSYGHDVIEPFRGAASYVDRILRGENPGDLPVQAPTKYETVINLRTAKVLGLTVPPGLLVAADEVIE